MKEASGLANCGAVISVSGVTLLGPTNVVVPGKAQTQFFYVICVNVVGVHTPITVTGVVQFLRI